MNPSTTDDRDLGRSMGDAACFGGMVGCGETYFSAFALAVGLGETASGLIASLPLLAGGVIQLISPVAIRWIGGLRRWVVTGAVLQSLAFVPLAYAAWIGRLSLSWMLLIASVYWAAGLATGPAWNTWMEHVVPSDRRVRFFSRRSRLQQICTFASLMGAGLLLQWTSANEYALQGFAVLFCIAGAFRLISAGFLYQTSDDESAVQRHRTLRGRRAETSEDRPRSVRPPSTAKRLLVYLVCMQAFIQLSGPFFVPYMLSQLEMGYDMYVLLISLAFVSKVLSMSFWGRVAERHGATRVLWFGGIGLVPLAALWIVSTNLIWLAAMQIISGIAWAAYELGFFLMFFEALPASQRTRLLTYYNFANTVAICIGAMTGAAILSCVGCHSETYHWLFGLSSIGRLLCLGLLIGVVVPRHSLHSIRLRILSVRPGAGSIASPITASEDRG